MGDVDRLWVVVWVGRRHRRWWPRGEAVGTFLVGSWVRQGLGKLGHACKALTNIHCDPGGVYKWQLRARLTLLAVAPAGPSLKQKGFDGQPLAAEPPGVPLWYLAPPQCRTMPPVPATLLLSWALLVPGI